MTRRGLAARLKRVTGLVTLVRTVRALATAQGRGLLRATARGAWRVVVPARHRHVDGPAPRAVRAGRRAPRRPPCATTAVVRLLDRRGSVHARRISAALDDRCDRRQSRLHAEARRAARRVDEAAAARIRFACADTPDALAHDKYDAVLSLSVLRHGDLDASRPVSSTAILPFARFAAAIEALDRQLRPGGLLVLWGCSFRFADTRVAPRYRTVATPQMSPQYGVFYGPDVRRLPDMPYAEFVFVKLA